MQRLILHIGTGKTGTSSIQNFFQHHRAVLASTHGVLYPDTGLTELHHFGELIYAHYQACEWAVQENRPALTQLRQAIEASGCPVAVLSCEDFYHRLGPQGIECLRQVFDGLEVQVLCYVRRQDQYMESAWKQQVKVGAMRMPFEDFLCRHTEAQYLPEVHGNYHRMLSDWTQVLDRSA